MILIKHIDFIEVDRDQVELAHFERPEMSYRVDSNEGDQIVPGEVIRELIKGKRFRRPRDNMDIYVGISKQAGDVLGLCYEAWDTMERALNNSSAIQAIALKQHQRLEAELKEIKSLTFFQRFQILFKGF